MQKFGNNLLLLNFPNVGLMINFTSGISFPSDPAIIQIQRFSPSYFEIPDDSPELSSTIGISSS